MSTEIQRPTPVVSFASDNTVRYTFGSAIGAGRLVAVIVLGQVSAGSITSVKAGASGFDPTTAGTDLTAATASASLINGTIFAQIFYLLVAPSGIVDVVATFSAMPGTYVKGIGGWEVDGFTNPVLDDAGNVTTGVAGGTTALAGMALTASDVAWGCALVATNGLSVVANPAAGNAWTAGGDIWASPNVATASIILGSAGSTTPRWTASANNASYLVSGALFKESPGGAAPPPPTGMVVSARETPIPMRPGPNGLGDGAPFALSRVNAAPIAPPVPPAADTPRPYAMVIPMRPGPGGLLIATPFAFSTTNPLFGAINAASVQSLPLSGSATATVADTAATSLALPLGRATTVTVLVTATSSLALSLGATAVAGVAVAASTSLPLPLTGVAAATGTATASSSVALPLAASATATVSLTAASNLVLPLAAVATATLSNTASSSRALPLGGTVVATNPIAAISSLALPLAGSVQAITSPGLDSTVRLPLSGNAAATVSLGAASVAPLPLAASSAVQLPIQAASNLALLLGNSAIATALLRVSSARPLPLTGVAAFTLSIGIASTARLPLVGSVTARVGPQFAPILPPITFTFTQQPGTAMTDSSIGVRPDDVGITLSGVLSFAGIEEFTDFDGWSAAISLLRAPGGRPLLAEVVAQLGAFDPVAKTVEVSYLSQTGDFVRTGKYRVEWTLAGPHGEAIHAPSPLVGQRFVVVEE